ncbi:hypothetical protein I4U23_008344 [Adineta vaga]|nr:hypothetical protein I4U23_008344 [Adineta vaga]
MITIEEILARFLFLFLKHLSIELNHLVILTKHHQTPLKSILRKASEKITSFHQNNSISLTQSITHRKVLFTHIDSLEFDPQYPWHSLKYFHRQQFYSSNKDSLFIQCLCHRSKKINFKTKHKIKLKR